MSQKKDTSPIINDPALPQTKRKPLSQRILSKTLDKTIQHAKEAVNFATDTTEDLIEVMGQATDFTIETIDHVAHHTKRRVANVSQFSANAMRGVVSETSEVARSVALNMARTFLGNTPLTFYLPEVLLNSQIRKRIDPTEIDHITVQCGNDQFQVEIDGHYRRFLYRLTLKFDVLECRIGQQKFLRLKQISEDLDLQIRHGGTLTNWAAKQVGHIGFEIANRIPVISIINHIIRDIPGIQQEKNRYWYIDLEKAGFIDFINNRSWMVEKLITLTDFSILPGLNILQESKELLNQLVDQFEICGLRIQPGRLEIQVSTFPTKNDTLTFP